MFSAVQSCSSYFYASFATTNANWCAHMLRLTNEEQLVLKCTLHMNVSHQPHVCLIPPAAVDAEFAAPRTHAASTANVSAGAVSDNA